MQRKLFQHIYISNTVQNNHDIPKPKNQTCEQMAVIGIDTVYFFGAPSVTIFIVNQRVSDICNNFNIKNTVSSAIVGG
jgi:hypothetical protein